MTAKSRDDIKTPIDDDYLRRLAGATFDAGAAADLESAPPRLGLIGKNSAVKPGG